RLDLLLARPVARMRGEERRRSATRRALHALPEGERAARIVAGTRHEQEPDVIGLRLLRAAVGKEHAELRAEPVGGEDRVGARAAAEPRAEQRAARLRDEPLADALGAVARERVRDLVPEHDREP